jgi:hypothetical protein
MSSCNNGNRFVCGMRRFDKHKVSVPDRPTTASSQETEQRLAEMIRLRELQDKGDFTVVPSTMSTSSNDTVQKKN